MVVVGRKKGKLASTVRDKAKSFNAVQLHRATIQSRDLCKLVGIYSRRLRLVQIRGYFRV